MKILCTICARKGSKGVPNKNIKKIKGIPLIDYSIYQAQKSGIFDEIIISTDCPKISKNVNKFGINNFFLRPKKLSGDKVGKIEVIKHALKRAETEYNTIFDVIIDLDVTSPLRSINDIKKAYLIFKKEKASNLITVCEARRSPFFNQIIKSKKNGVKLVKNSGNTIKRRQDSPVVYDMNASIYIWKKEYLNKSVLFGKKTSIYVMPPERSIDIDSKFDLKLVNFLLKKINV